MKAERARTTTDALLVVAYKCVVSLIVLATGFRAVSDDDYSRIVIAQQFAESPRLDPSGTSWLPLPFWLSGAVLRLVSTELWVARAVAFAFGLLATLLVWSAARNLGLGRRAAVLSALIAAAFPYSAWLGVAAVPEALTAGLIVIGAALANRREAAHRHWGALALSLACLCRYEAWPAAAGFALLTAWDARHRPRLWTAAILAVSGAAGWLLHGLITHDNALFFVKRVADYQRALGGSAEPLYQRLLGTPLAALRCEPGLAGLALGTGLTARWAGKSFAHLRRLSLVLALVIVFLVAGDVRSTAATHHEERTLLPIWFGFAILLAESVLYLARRRPRLLLAATVTWLGVAAFVLRPWYARRDGFIDRSDQIAVGKLARELGTEQARLAIDTPDFAFYAVIAGFGSPSRAAPLADRDPRRATPDAFASPNVLSARLTGFDWLVTTGPAHAQLATEVGTPRAERGDLTLFQLRVAPGR